MNRYYLLCLTCLTLLGCGGGTSSTNTSPPTTSNNQSPIITSIEPISAYERDRVEIKAIANDSDGQITSYKWSQISGTTVVSLQEDNSGTLTFDAPSVSSDEQLEFSLTVIDNDGASATQTVGVTLTAYPEADLTAVTDSALFSCLRNQATDSHSKSLTCHGYPILSLEGIAELSQLESLEISNAALQNTDALLTLDKLKSLRISNNYTDVTLNLEGMVQLESLCIQGNTINGIEDQLANLPALTTLELEYGQAGHQYIYLYKLANPANLTVLKIKGYNIYEPDFVSSFSNISELVLSDANLSSLNFLQQFDQLEKLDISDNPYIRTLDPLKALPQLESLNIAGSYIDDITPIHSLTSLKQLWLGNHREGVDISFIEQMDSLETLSITHTSQIYNVDSIAKSTGLTNLQLVDVGIEKIDFISGLTKLETLNLSSNPVISDISAFVQLKSLKTLNLSNIYNLSKIGSLASLDSLEWLDLSSVGNGNTLDSSPLKALLKLTYLDIDNVYFDDLSFLPLMTQLKDLTLSSQHDDVVLPDLSALTQLNNLDITSVNADNADSISTATAIVSLEISYLSTSNFTFLAGMENLRSLIVHNTYPELKSGTGLEQATQLQSLSVWINNITSMPNLAALTALNYLDLQSSKLANLDFLRNSYSLKYLNVKRGSALTCQSLDDIESSLTLIEFIRPQNCVE